MVTGQMLGAEAGQKDMINIQDLDLDRRSMTDAVDVVGDGREVVTEGLVGYTCYDRHSSRL